MSGKLFNSSANIYQDQAKVLFDYYKQAAEKIVAEEEKYEMEIAICKERIAQLSQDFKEVKQKRLLNIIFFFYLFQLILHIQLT